MGMTYASSVRGSRLANVRLFCGFYFSIQRGRVVSAVSAYLRKYLAFGISRPIVGFPSSQTEFEAERSRLPRSPIELRSSSRAF